jgi:HEAT repeat protein
MTQRLLNIRIPLAMLFMTSLLLVGGCFETEPQSTATAEDRKAICEYWPKRLASPSKMDDAFKYVSKAKCVSALGDLEKLFDANQSRSKVLSAVRKIGSPSASVPILKKALGDSKLAKRAVSLVGRWKLKSLRPQLLAILTDEGREGDRLPALEAVLSMGDPGQYVALLTKLSSTDLNLQEPRVNEVAIKALQDLKAKTAVPQIIISAFLQSNDGQSVYQAARRTLAALSPHATAALAAASKNTFAPLVAAGKKYSLPPWEWTTGQRISQLLADTLDKNGAQALAENMSLSIAGMPLGVKGNPKMEQMWAVNQKNRLNIAHFGLGHMGSDLAVPTLEKLVKDDTADTVYQRLKAARSLAYIGSPKAIEALFRIWDTDPLYNPEKRRAKKNALFLGPLTLPLAMAIDWAHLKEFDKRLKGVDKMLCSADAGDVKCVKANLDDAETQAHLKVVRKCRNLGKCYIDELKSENKHRVMKSALILARGLTTNPDVKNGVIGNNSDAIEGLLARVKRTRKAQSDIRRFCFIALTRIGTAGTGQKILDLLKLPRFQGRMWKVETRALGLAMKAQGR